VVQAGNVIPARANIMYNTVENEHQVSYEQAKPRTNKEKSSFPHLRRITHLSDVMQPPTNRKNGAQIAHEKNIKGISLPFYLGSIILYCYDVSR
jgi:hypothetical protein